MSDSVRGMVQNTLDQLNVATPPSAVDNILKYVQLMCSWNRVYNLTAIKKEQEVVRSLVVPSIRMFEVVSRFSTIMDLGSGGGIPGVVLAALAQDDQTVTCVEKVGKKAAFIKVAAAELGLKNLNVSQVNFLDLEPRGDVGVIVSRGSAPLDTQLQWTQAWRQHGTLLLSVQTQESQQQSSSKVQPSETVCLDKTLGLWGLVYGKSLA
ncbi:MAG: 16S rRNA (guanine(527)-N(7))-methyltransferase RsmG [Pseudomonadota bacterium]|nr:16S rRNA (guanine(527)-N(7))-methyltransferase RsmG [Pseudomonadota bacterium]MEC8461162.1 16S rRNA (guanine(527)-N(7))-methyltransferase RsmG [Pseudomonadota bacterium]